MSGALSYHSDLAAEEAIAEIYKSTGYTIAEKWWRSKAGEIDLIARKGENIIFIEVKKARSIDAAARQLNARQTQRIYRSAAVYLEGEPNGQDAGTRFDVVLVDGAGQTHILENAIIG